MKIKPKIILILVVISALFLMVSQIYNNINLYNQNKETILKDINTTLDNSVEYYYNEITKNNFIAVVGDNNSFNYSFKFFEDIDSIVKPNNSKITKKVKIIKKENIQSNVFTTETQIKIFNSKKKVDSIANIQSLTNKFIMSFKVDAIDFKAFEKYFIKELKRKNINLDFQLELINNNNTIQRTKNLESNSNVVKMENQSSFLPNSSKLVLKFSNPTSIILKKSLFNLLLSTFIIIFIILLLVYMLWIIQKQKKLDEIKNDFISNITHELKTPITTIQAAIEGIKFFNQEKNEEKTNKYLDIAQNQNQKLNTIVEKILETATLEVNNLKLNKEPTDISNLLEIITLEFKQNNSTKKFFINLTTNVILNVDVFHFQNVINNILDNAIKYGGDEIKINMYLQNQNFNLEISDSGIIDLKEKEIIFEKFYRINQGNLHNTKGFGIGLYYAKKIIELHQGTLEIKPTKNTTFLITLPYEEN